MGAQSPALAFVQLSRNLAFASSSVVAVPFVTPHIGASKLACDGHHKMSDLDAAGEPVHSAAESVAPVCSLRVDGGMGRRDHHGARIMTSYPVVSENISELTEAELNEVSGGADVTILGVEFSAFPGFSGVVYEMKGWGGDYRHDFVPY
jgi:hypothetical protein